MAHYAFLNTKNKVIEVISGIDETETIEGVIPEIWYAKYRGKKCVRTSYNNRIRKQYASIGYTYDENYDVFIAPQPYGSWILNDNFDWQAPKPKPEGNYYWDEQLQKWIPNDF
tara:strand:+ start:673 stop:1011 length:339 start_codon:yes stop_codon:yes gene_type:complete